tara:strand:+ start:10167 stop:11390 length:1224 start_codon:yes stop_codon:yes gene_type:complete
MRNFFIFLIILILFSSSAISQTYYEPGYFITNNGKVNEVLIKNEDWQSNPTNFTYKIDKETKAQSEDITNVKEFGIGSYVKFFRVTVDIDKSSNDINRLSRSRTPDFESETVFLKVLVEGKGNLYFYKSKNLERYFFKTENSEIEQLINRRFLIGASIVSDTKFQDQLKFNIHCPDFDAMSYSSISYSQKSLVSFFKGYNECNDVQPVVYLDTRKRDLFRLSLKPGIRSANLDVSFIYDDIFRDFISESSFSNYNSFSFGIESEYTLPYNNNKWSIILEPTFNNYQAKGETERGNPIYINISLLEFPLGLRYKFFLTPENVLYLNLFATYSIAVSEKFNYGVGGTDYLFTPSDLEPIPGLMLGAGYLYNNKLSIDFKITTKNQLFGQDQEWSAKYSYMSLVLGYSIF